MDLLDTDYRGLVHPVPLGWRLDNHRALNRKKMSHPLPSVTKDCNLKNKNVEVVDTYGVYYQLAPVAETVSASHLLRKINSNKSSNLREPMKNYTFKRVKISWHPREQQ